MNLLFISWNTTNQFNVPDISSNTTAYHGPVWRNLFLQRFFAHILSFHFLNSTLVWLLRAYVSGRCVMEFRVCGQLFPYSYCLSYWKCNLAECLYLCEVCRWMNTGCSSLCSFCLWFVLYYLYNWCFNFTNPFVRALCSSFATPFGHHPFVIICYSLWSCPFVRRRLVVFICSAPFGHRLPAPFILCSVKSSLLKYFLCIGKPII